jgi:adenosylhomocysteine nucleosidase
LAPDDNADPASLPSIAILYALPEEMRCLRYECEELAISAGGECVRRHSRPGAVAAALCIGVGGRSARRNAELLIRARPSLRALLIVGYAGSLPGGPEPGGLVIAETVLDAAGGHVYRPNAGLLAAAAALAQNPSPARVDVTARPLTPLGPRLRARAAAPVRMGKLVTTAHVVVRAAEKREIGRETGAIAVDMESAGAAAAATENGVPWLAVRVITDGADDDLPLDFNALSNPDGSIDRARIVASTLLHPWKIPALIRLGRRSALGAQTLADFLRLLLPRVDDSAGESPPRPLDG